MEEPGNGKWKAIGGAVGVAVLVVTGGIGLLQTRSEPTPELAPLTSVELAAIRAEIAQLKLEQAKQATETAALIRLGAERNDRLTALERRVDEQVRQGRGRP